MSTDADLVAAVESGDVAAAAAAIVGGASPDACPPGDFGYPVLTTAAGQGSAELVSLLLAAGAAPDPTYPWEWTPLRAAAFHGRAAVVRQLLQAGVDPNRPGERESLLMEAVAATGHHPSPQAVLAVQALLTAGATVRPDDDPALVLAVAAGAPAAVLRLLLAHGGDPDARRRDGAPALVIAAKRRNLTAVEVLLEAGATVDAFDADGRTALMHAVERGSQATVASLLCASADALLPAADGSTAHGLARSWNHHAIPFLFGETSVGPEHLDLPRTVLDARPATVRLRGDATEFQRWSVIVSHVLTNLGDDEFVTLVGQTADQARAVGARLAQEHQPTAYSGTLRVLDLTTEEWQIVRGALLNLAYGPALPPPGISHLDVCDLYENITHAGF